MKFNKKGWNEYGDAIPCPPLREKMLDDLLKNHKLKGLTYGQLIDKLGTPTKYEDSDSNCVSYEIIVKYGNLDPVFIKTLDFYYNKDSIITEYKTREFEVDL